MNFKNSQIVDGTSVAVVDDIEQYAKTTAGIVEEAGLVPTIVSEGHGNYTKTDQLWEQICSTEISAVVCDHRLSHTPFASFTGAKFLASLYDLKVPGMLLSTFSADDGETTGVTKTRSLLLWIERAWVQLSCSKGCASARLN